MRSNSKGTLVKKDAVNAACFGQLFEALSQVPLDFDRFHAYLRSTITGHYTIGCPIILRAGDVSDKAWFITDGAVVAYFIDCRDRKIVNLFFKKGEFVVLPEEFMSGNPSTSFLMACPNTHLLEISAEDVKHAFVLFPETEQQYRMIIAKQAIKYKERDMLLSYLGIDRVREFFRRWPEFRDPNPKIIFSNRMISSYLQMTEISYSRLLKQIREEDDAEV